MGLLVLLLSLACVWTELDDCDWTDTQDRGTCALSGNVGLSGADMVITGERDDERFGNRVAGVGDVDANGVDDFVVGSTDDVAYLVTGPGELGWRGRSEVDTWVTGCGFCVASGGDVYGDGRDELLLATVPIDSSGPRPLLYVFSGLGVGAHGPEEAVAVLLDEVEVLGPTPVLADVDFNADSADDLAIALPAYAEDAVGRVLVFHGPVEGELQGSEADRVLTGEGPGDRAGAALESAGDVDGDGLRDLLVAAPMADRGGVDSGVVYLLTEEVGTGALLADADSLFVGEAAGDLAGSCTAGSGLAGGQDVDGDGLDDFMIAAAEGEAVYVITTPRPGRVDLSDVTDVLVFDDGTRFGEIDLSADMNGDERADLLVGVMGLYQDGDLDTGSRGVYLYRGGEAGARPPETADMIVREDSSVSFFGRFGDELGAVGDVDGDGLGDLLMGVSDWRPSNGETTRSGAAFLLLGRQTP